MKTVVQWEYDFRKWSENMIERSQVDVNQTWDLSHLFKTEEVFNEALEDLKGKVEAFQKEYEGQITTAHQVNVGLATYRALLEQRGKISAYCNLAVSANTRDKEAQTRAAQTRTVLAGLDAKLSFFESELSQLDDAVLEEARANKEDALYIERLLEDKKHLLSKDVEATLAALGNTLDAGYQAYNDIKFKDMHFPDVEADGQVIPMTYNSFEGRMQSEPNTAIRREAFKVFSDTLRKYQHSTASAYNTQIQKEKTMATLRGFDSVFDYLLDRQKVSRELYDRQIDVIMEELAPHMRKFARLIKEIYQLDEVRYEDLKLEVDPTYAAKVTYDEAKQYILEGLAPLGEGYLKIMKEAFDNRWIDYAETIGKRTGAFCSSPYGANSFILMFFTEDMNDCMTLAHELGHAGHFQLAYKHQNILDGRPSMYFVEAPSTTNELLVEFYLKNKAGDDLRMKRWISSQMVAKTYYHNFVTHLLEAYFQREVYRLVDAGKSLDADTLNHLFKETLAKFWGPEVVLTEGAELTWMRQPHYYMGLYSYTYSAGLTIGTQVAKMIQKDSSVANTWVEVLKMGGTKSAEELAKAAGVDVSTDAPLKDTIATIGGLIDEIVDITKQLNA